MHGRPNRRNKAAFSDFSSVENEERRNEAETNSPVNKIVQLKNNRETR